MHRKNFPDRWIDWIRQAVEGGKVCVNMNGDWREYFSTFRGLRQGDPLSPLLFPLVADTVKYYYVRVLIHRNQWRILISPQTEPKENNRIIHWCRRSSKP